MAPALAHTTRHPLSHVGAGDSPSRRAASSRGAVDRKFGSREDIHSSDLTTNDQKSTTI